MKKQLLLAALLLSAGSTFAIEPQVVDDFFSVSLSPNGEWWIGQLDESSIEIRNLVTGQSYVCTGDNEYGLGPGNVVSNNGIVIGILNYNDPAYWENGKWTLLPVVREGNTSVANGILADGSIICGNVGMTDISIDAQEIMAIPALWYRQSDGTYGEPVILPYPTLDFTGRIPQYVTAVDMTADGKTVIGQVVDYSGIFCYPIIYTCNAAGQWTYELLHPELINPSEIEFPEYPGEFELTCSQEDFMSPEELAAYNQALDNYWSFDIPYPEPEQFMSDEEYDKYMAALEQYYETWENYPDYLDYMTETELAIYEKALEEYYEQVAANKYPEYADYMTEEELAQYAAAKEIYDAAYDEWYEKYSAFENALYACMDEGYIFLMNNTRISGDGKYMISTRSATILNDDPMAWMPFKDVYYPVCFNLEDGTYQQYTEAENIVISCITDDYSILGSFMDPDYLLPRRAYIIPQLDGDNVMPLEDYIAKTNAEVAQWMVNTMMHQVLVGVDEMTWDYIFEDYMCSGVPLSTPDMSLFVTGIENSWDDDNPAYYFSYVIPGTGLTNGVSDVADNETCDVNVLSDGTVQLVGDFDSLTVYNVAGVTVFAAEHPAATVHTGLTPGLYVVKAVATDGSVVVKKVNI